MTSLGEQKLPASPRAMHGAVCRYARVRLRHGGGTHIRPWFQTDLARHRVSGGLARRRDACSVWHHIVGATGRRALHSGSDGLR